MPSGRQLQNIQMRWKEKKNMIAFVDVNISILKLLACRQSERAAWERNQKAHKVSYNLIWKWKLQMLPKWGFRQHGAEEHFYSGEMSHGLSSTFSFTATSLNIWWKHVQVRRTPEVQLTFRKCCRSLKTKVWKKNAEKGEKEGGGREWKKERRDKMNPSLMNGQWQRLFLRSAVKSACLNFLLHQSETKARVCVDKSNYWCFSVLPFMSASHQTKRHRGIVKILFSCLSNNKKLLLYPFTPIIVPPAS